MREQLRKLLKETHGAQGVALVNSDGVVVAVETMEVSAEPDSGVSDYGMAIEQLGAINDVFPLGEPMSIKIESGARTTLMGRVNKHYFLAVWLAGQTVSKRAAFNLRLATTDLQLSL